MQVTNNYSPTAPLTNARRYCLYAALILGYGMAYQRRHLAYLSVNKRFMVVSAPLLALRTALGFIKLPRRQAHCTHPYEPSPFGSEDTDSSCRKAARFFTEPLRPMIYQHHLPCVKAGWYFSHQIRFEALEALGAKRISVEALHSRHGTKTLMLDGFRIRSRDYLAAVAKRPQLAGKAQEKLQGYLASHDRFLTMNIPRKRSGPRECVLLFPTFGNNSGHMMRLAQAILLSGRDVQVVDWREFGSSDGFASAEGTRRDTEAMVRAALKDYEKLSFYGHCAGSFHAVYGANYAEQIKPVSTKAVILDRFPMTLGVIACPGLGALADWGYPYDCEAELQRVKPWTRVGIIRGTEDPVVARIGQPDPNVERAKEILGDQARTCDLAINHMYEWYRDPRFQDGVDFMFQRLGA